VRTQGANFGIDSSIRTANMSGCKIPRVTGVHRARTIASPPTASLVDPAVQAHHPLCGVVYNTA
jgi:hypothetical protein